MIMLFYTNQNQSVEKLSQVLEDLNDREKDKVVAYTIEIKKNKPIRSVKANRYYWAILKRIGAAAGYSEDELHEFYKKKFNHKYILDEVVGLTTSDMDQKEFSDYVKKVKDHARNFFEGVIIPEPEDEKYAAWEMMTKNNYDQMFSAT